MGVLTVTPRIGSSHWHRTGALHETQIEASPPWEDSLTSLAPDLNCRLQAIWGGEGEEGSKKKSARAAGENQRFPEGHSPDGETATRGRTE
jgi:hypothetical protein